MDDKPATVSKKIIDFIRFKIGFNGFLITDDISMGALGDDIVSSAEKCLHAGCDAVLHCNGSLSDMTALEKVIPELTEQAKERLILANGLLSWKM
jgi:beta-N-acetylhexosaminidase